MTKYVPYAKRLHLTLLEVMGGEPTESKGLCLQLLLSSLCHFNLAQLKQTWLWLVHAEMFFTLSLGTVYMLPGCLTVFVSVNAGEVSKKQDLFGNIFLSEQRQAFRHRNALPQIWERTKYSLSQVEIWEAIP